MRDTRPQVQGWLRTEIAAALDKVARKPYVSQEQKERIQQTASAINDSDRLRGPRSQQVADAAA
jgi:hypothetical protein